MASSLLTSVFLRDGLVGLLAEGVRSFCYLWRIEYTILFVAARAYIYWVAARFDT